MVTALLLSGPPAGTATPAVEVPSDAAPELPLPGPPTESPAADATRAPPGEARNLEHPPREPEDAALALPRAVLTVPRVVITGITMPITQVMHVLDDRAIARARRVFFWNRNDTLGWMPILSFQGGYGFSLGARIFHDDVFGHGESLSLDARSGGLYWQAYQLRFHGSRIGGARIWLDARGRWDATPRLIFQGIGNGPPASARERGLDPYGASVRTRYSQQRGLAALRLGTSFGPRNREIRPGVGLVYNHRTFDGEHRGQAFLLGPDDEADRSTDVIYDVDRLPGFRSGVDVVRLSGSLELDFRDHRGRTSRGFHWLVLGGGAPPQLRGVAFAHYGTELTAFADLFRRTRVLVARVVLEAVEGADRRIPFSELPRLGGPMRMRGYRLNRFRDKRVLMGTLEYRYPIHQVLAGHFFADVGRVAHGWRELLDGRVEPWRLGFGGGFEFRALEKVYLRLDLSYGEDFLVFFSTDPLWAFTDRHELEL